MSSWNAVWSARSIHPAISEDQWLTFVADVAEQLQVTEGARIYDVGCGSGLLLHSFHDAGCPVGGIEREAPLLDIARIAMPDGQWTLGAPGDLDPAEPWDFITCFGVFETLPDLDYGRGVLARMTAKATQAIAVLGVPGTRYEERWFLRVLTEAGASAVQFSPHLLEGEPHAPSRFDVFAKV